MVTGKVSRQSKDAFLRSGSQAHVASHEQKREAEPWHEPKAGEDRCGALKKVEEVAKKTWRDAG